MMTIHIIEQSVAQRRGKPRAETQVFCFINGKERFIQPRGTFAGIAIILCIGVSSLFAEVVQESGDFVAEVERLKNLAIAKDSGLYIPPTSEQQSNFTVVAESLFLGQIHVADSNALSLGYELVEFTDTNTSLVLHGLREIQQGGEQTTGWGSYFVNLSAEVNDLIEVPHPIFDTHSWDVASRTFLDTRAQGNIIFKNARIF